MNNAIGTRTLTLLIVVAACRSHKPDVVAPTPVTQRQIKILGDLDVALESEPERLYYPPEDPSARAPTGSGGPSVDRFGNDLHEPSILDERSRDNDQSEKRYIPAGAPAQKEQVDPSRFAPENWPK